MWLDYYPIAMKKHNEKQFKKPRVYLSLEQYISTIDGID